MQAITEPDGPTNRASADPVQPDNEDSITKIDKGWLRRQAPTWLTPAIALLSLFDTAIIVAQAGLLALLAGRALIDQSDVASLMPLLWLLLAVLLFRGLAAGLRQWLVAGASARARLDLRQRLLQSYADAAPGQLESSGVAVTTYDEQVEALDGYYLRFLPQSISALIVPPILVIIVLFTDWVAGLLLALAVPLIPIFMILIGLGAQQLSETHYRSLARLGGWFLDQVQGASTIRLFQAETQAMEAVRSRTQALRRETMRVLRVAFLSSAVLEFFSAVAIASIAIYIGLGLLGYLTFGPVETLTLTSGLFVLLLAPEIFQPIRTLSQGWHDRADARGALVAIGEQLKLIKARPEAEADYKPAARVSCALVLEQLSFAHPGRKPLFQALDLSVADGERVALIGPSGGGKSTLIHLLAGFAHPQSGRILLDGQLLTRFNDAGLVEHVAWLGQRPILFKGTIAENIAMGWPEASAAEIQRIARIARVDEFAARMPQGLESAVGEGGYGLSGGQAQRIALARALLRPKPLVLLDEPTASLDPAGERLVLEAMDELFAERACTVICASHRAATIRWADRVIEVCDGALSDVSSEGLVA